MDYKLIINCKTYDEAFDNGFENIENACLELLPLAKEKKVELILCPNILDSGKPKQKGLVYYAQHVDAFLPGSHTGHILPSHLERLGFSGVLISHSEDFEQVDDIISKVDFLKQHSSLLTCVCARNDVTAKQIASCTPDMIAVEPKELIGGDISVTTANPSLISTSLNAISPLPLLVGAGVKNKDDVQKAVELGAKGILVASGVVKAKDVFLAIKDLLEGF
jgi:triosephosphate isomerase